jgi:hypothetical protein
MVSVELDVPDPLSSQCEIRCSRPTPLTVWNYMYQTHSGHSVELDVPDPFWAVWN